MNPEPVPGEHCRIETQSASFDRALAIRRSVRCFIFGWIALTPLFGLSMAWLTFWLQRQIAQQTGDYWNFKPVRYCYFFGLLIPIGLLVVALWKLATIAVIVCIGALFILLRRQYRRSKPREWNPARHLVYWGVAMAYTGVILSAASIIGAVYLVLRARANS